MTDSDRDDHIERDATVEVTDGSRSLGICRVHTPKGTRLEIDGETDRIRLDPLALESITWQDADDFPLELPSSPPSFDDADVVSSDDPVQIANEFAQVTFTKVVTDAGDALDLASPKLGFSIRLSASHLESIARQDPEAFSSFLEDPYGPEDEH